MLAINNMITAILLFVLLCNVAADEQDPFFVLKDHVDPVVLVPGDSTPFHADQLLVPRTDIKLGFISHRTGKHYEPVGVLDVKLDRPAVVLDESVQISCDYQNGGCEAVFGAVVNNVFLDLLTLWFEDQEALRTAITSWTNETIFVLYDFHSAQRRTQGNSEPPDYDDDGNALSYVALM